jgi:hypothetical protein
MRSRGLLVGSKAVKVVGRPLSGTLKMRLRSLVRRPVPIPFLCPPGVYHAPIQRRPPLLLRSLPSPCHREELPQPIHSPQHAKRTVITRGVQTTQTNISTTLQPRTSTSISTRQLHLQPTLSLLAPSCSSSSPSQGAGRHEVIQPRT